MDVLKVDGTCYIWYARGKFPYSIDLTYPNPVAVRNFELTISSEQLQKEGFVERVKWEYVPDTVKNCIVSLQEILMEDKETTPY